MAVYMFYYHLMEKIFGNTNVGNFVPSEKSSISFGRLCSQLHSIRHLTQDGDGSGY